MRIRKIILLLGDVVMLYASLVIALIVRYRGIDLNTIQNHILPFSIIYVLWLIVFYINNLYDLDIAKNNVKFFSALIRALVVNGLISIVFFYAAPKSLFGDLAPKTNLLLNIIFFIILFYVWRSSFNLIIGSLRIKTNIAIVGYNPQAIELAKEIIKNPQLGYKLRLIIKNQEPIDKIDLPEVKITQGLKNLKEILEQEKIATAIIVPEVYKYPGLIQNLFDCIRYKIDFVNLSEFYEKITQKVPLNVIDQVWFLENISQRNRATYEFLKRIFDFIFATILLITSLPLWLIIALIIKFESPGPIFYKQTRIGQGGKPFNLIKFRSMYATDANGGCEKDGPQMTQEYDKRVTKFGRLLRRTRLDEIPQFLNIIKGQMSFAGPRAERPEFHQKLRDHIPFYQERYLIKPGLSGWAQIKHGYSSSIKDNFEKIQHDLYYIKNRSFILDLSIILKTINVIIRRKGR